MLKSSEVFQSKRLPPAKTNRTGYDVTYHAGHRRNMLSCTHLSAMAAATPACLGRVDPGAQPGLLLRVDRGLGDSARSPDVRRRSRPSTARGGALPKIRGDDGPSGLSDPPVQEISCACVRVIRSVWKISRAREHVSVSRRVYDITIEYIIYIYRRSTVPTRGHHLSRTGVRLICRELARRGVRSSSGLSAGARVPRGAGGGDGKSGRV